MVRILIIGLLSIVIQACSDVNSTEKDGSLSLKPEVKPEQLILVNSADWDSFKAEMVLLEKGTNGWIEKDTFKAVIGRNGFGIGKGIVPISDNNFVQKKEGDGKSPAGIFSLGQLMGYSPTLPKNVNWNFKQLTSNVLGVDDSGSLFYNQIIDTSQVKDAVFNSYEVMKRADDQYKWLYEINHNRENIPGLGSLIFLHIWKDENTGTAGCTAISESDFNKLMTWMKKDKNPLIIQGPSTLKTEFLKEFTQ